MLQAAILDDEPLARSRLRRLLEKVARAKVKVAAECVDVDELIDVAKEIPLDVVFLDISLPGDDGFTVLKRWPGPPPQVVFVTAYEQYGVRAFEGRAVDYLVKPVSAERLRETVSRLKSRPLSEADAGQPRGRLIALDVGRRTRLVREDEIQVIRANGNYLDIETLGGTFTLREPLTTFLGTLDANAFTRIHRSTAIRSAAVREVMAIGSGRYRITLECGMSVVSGRHYRAFVQRLMQRYGDSPVGSGT